MRFRGLLVAACLSLVATEPAATKGTVEVEAGLRATLDAFRERYGFPGATAAIALPDGTIVTAATGLAIGYVDRHNPFGMPQRTADAEGHLLWNPAVESAGGGFASTSQDLVRWGQLLFRGEALSATYLDRLLDGVPVAPDTPGILYGAGVAIHAETPRGPVYGHGGWIPGYVSSLRYYADHDVTVAFQVNTDMGFLDDSSDRVTVLEAALADLAIGAVRGSRGAPCR